MLTSSRPPSFLPSFHLGLGVQPSMHCGSYFVSTSVASISPFGLLIMPVGYVITGRVQVFIVQTLFLLFNWLFRTCLTLCRYLTLAAGSWFQFSCRTQRSLQLSTSALLTSGSSTPSVQIIFPLFDSVQPHLSSSNDFLDVIYVERVETEHILIISPRLALSGGLHSPHPPLPLT